MSGAVVIHVPGAVSVSTSYWRNEKSDPWKAYNAIPIVRPWEPVERGAARLRDLVTAYRSTLENQSLPKSDWPAREPEQLSPRESQNDVFEALTKLAALRDAGVITDEEFEAKKVELLARL
jgi:hypothetical protein